ncbi:MAG: hypothetical protein HY619_02105 [Thaumarchaeota archaeon]|nr:hypothetical protein [Nitrososphaerota archaeon]
MIQPVGKKKKIYSHKNPSTQWEMSAAHRTVDKKRRVTLPSNTNITEGTKVIAVSAPDAVLITSNKNLAERFKETVSKLKLNHKIQALDEWENLLTKAGLLSLDSEEIETKVGETIPRPKTIKT